MSNSIQHVPWDRKTCSLCDGKGLVRMDNWFHDRNGFLKAMTQDVSCPVCKGRGYK